TVLGFQFPIPDDNPNTVVVLERRSLLLSDAQNSFPTFHISPHNHIRSWLGVPLIVHDKVIGMLALDSVELNYFTPRHAELAMAFADQVAVAIENARLFETTQQNEFEAKTARDILHRLNSVSDILEAFPQVTAGLKDLTGCGRISLALLSEDKSTFTMVALDHPDPELSQGTILPITATSAADDVLAGQIHITPDLSEESHHPAEKSLFEGGHRSRINIPLQTPDGIIGALNLTWPHPNGFLSYQLPILSQVADAIALAVQKARLYEMQSHRAKKLDDLRAAIAIISSELEIQKLYDTIVERAVSLVDATGGELGIYLEQQQVLESSACYQMDKDYR
ncbi:GAF domain-containing protein, partial [bacterium]|nr:GAF domain-containing protein [bacterium]